MRRPTLDELPPAPSGQAGWPWARQSPRRLETMPQCLACPRISLITPSYNQAQFIEETIRSVLLQGYPNLEYIIIDGGSTDDSVEIIKKYESWIAHWVSEPDRGQAHALNKGFALASGQIFAYLNSDDVLTEGTLHRIADALQGGLDRAIIVTFAGVEFGEGREEVLRTPAIQPAAEDWLGSPVSLFQPSTFWTRVLHERLGGFKENLSFCFDKEFFFRAVFQVGSYHAKPYWVASRFRLHPESKTSSLSDVMWAENRAILNAYKTNYFCSVEQLDIALKREKLALTAQAKIRSALGKEGLLERATLLVGAAIANPRELRSRFYLGAWKKVLFESAKSPWGKRRSSAEDPNPR